MPNPTAAEGLPLMREVDSPLGEDGGRETSKDKSLPQSFALQNPAPSSEGAGVRCVHNRICGSGARHASERKIDETIGSAGKRP